MASGRTGNVVPGNRLRVRLPCPPLFHARNAILAIAGLKPRPDVVSGSPAWCPGFAAAGD